MISNVIHFQWLSDLQLLLLVSKKNTCIENWHADIDIDITDK